MMECIVLCVAGGGAVWVIAIDGSLWWGARKSGGLGCPVSCSCALLGLPIATRFRIDNAAQVLE